MCRNDKHTEIILNKFGRNFVKKQRTEQRSKEDQFTIYLLESIKSMFCEDAEYSGKEVRLRIDTMIKRME